MRVDGIPVDVPGRRPRALLAVLALSAGQPLSVETLYERVWGDDEPGDVRGYLYSCVRRLRAVLGSEVIANAAGSYTLAVQPDAVDVLRFAALLDQAQRATPEQQGPLVREATALWRATPFAEPLSDWLNEVEARRLTERYLSAVERRADADLATGDGGGSIAELQQLASEHPLRETLWARLLVALGRTGRQAEALAAYEQVRRRLADDLGIDPSRELQAIYAGLLDGTTPGSPAAAAAKPAAVVPRQLPAGDATFTGRHGALAALDQQLAGADDHKQPVVITGLHGMGGVGKTTLAVHWAHRVSEQFPDGQLFVNLRGYGPGQPMTAATALDLLLRGLGVPGDEIPADVDARSALFRSRLAGRRLLVVLDNARDADQVRPLLPGSGSMVLVTSRGQLRGLAAREGARRIALDTLSAEESVALLDARLTEQGVTRHPAGLAELARLCGYLPLALVIAAERAGRYDDGLAVVIEDLENERDRLSALDADDGDDTSLRAVFSWSYQALDPDTARLFRLLGLPRGTDISAEAAAALAGTTTAVARRLLDRLVDLSLVEQRPDQHFALHDHVRAYAAELCRDVDAEDDREAALDRLEDWCVRSARAAASAIEPGLLLLESYGPSLSESVLSFTTAESALGWLRDEGGFLIAMAHAAAESRPGVLPALATLLWRELVRRQAFDDATALLTAAVPVAEAQGDPFIEAKVRNTLAITHVTIGRDEAAAEQLEHAARLFRQAGSVAGEARALGNLGVVVLSQGHPRKAIALQQAALELKKVHDDERQLASTFNNLARAYLEASEVDPAVEAARRAVVLYRDNTASNHALALETLAHALSRQGNHAEAIACSRKSCELVATQDDPADWARKEASLGMVLRAAGRNGEARQAILRAFEALDRLGVDEVYELTRSDLVELLASVSPVRSA